MPARHDWNVVVVGYWNRAILTPAGIAKRLFEVAEGTPVAVEVPMDVVGAYRVRHEGLTVSLQGTQLIIGSDVSDFRGLGRAMTVAGRAIAALPVTPLIAAGINVRYRQEPVTAPLAGLTKAQLEDHLSDAGFSVSQRTLQLSVAFQQGQLNVSVQTLTEGPCEIVFNFHRTSESTADLQSWLATPIEEVERATNEFLRLLGVNEEIAQ